MSKRNIHNLYLYLIYTIIFKFITIFIFIIMQYLRPLREIFFLSGNSFASKEQSGISRGHDDRKSNVNVALT